MFMGDHFLRSLISNLTGVPIGGAGGPGGGHQVWSLTIFSSSSDNLDYQPSDMVDMADFLESIGFEVDLTCLNIFCSYFMCLSLFLNNK